MIEMGGEQKESERQEEKNIIREGTDGFVLSASADAKYQTCSFALAEGN